MEDGSGFFGSRPIHGFVIRSVSVEATDQTGFRTLELADRQHSVRSAMTLYLAAEDLDRLERRSCFRGAARGGWYEVQPVGPTGAASGETGPEGTPRRGAPGPRTSASVQWMRPGSAAGPSGLAWRRRSDSSARGSGRVLATTYAYQEPMASCRRPPKRLPAPLLHSS
jgi:hypothetical protein